MKSRLMQKVISVVLTAAILLPLVTGVAYADGLTKPSSPADLSPQEEQIALNEARQSEMEQAIAVLEPYVVRNEDGTFSLLIDDPQKVGVRSEVFAQLKASMERINELVRKGTLVTDENLDVRPADDQSSRLDNHQAVYSAGCPGHTFFEFHWWGYSFGMDHCVTNNIIYALSIGTGIAGIAAILAATNVIPGDEVLFAIAAIIVAAGAATFDWADNQYGCGAVVHRTWNGWWWISPGTC